MRHCHLVRLLSLRIWIFKMEESKKWKLEKFNSIQREKNKCCFFGHIILKFWTFRLINMIENSLYTFDWRTLFKLKFNAIQFAIKMVYPHIFHKLFFLLHENHISSFVAHFILGNFPVHHHVALWLRLLIYVVRTYFANNKTTRCMISTIIKKYL